jgi:hypothetical protein
MLFVKNVANIFNGAAPPIPAGGVLVIPHLGEKAVKIA